MKFERILNLLDQAIEEMNVFNTAADGLLKACERIKHQQEMESLEAA